MHSHKNVPILLFKEGDYMLSIPKSIISESAYRIIGHDNKNYVPHKTNRVEIIQFWSDGGYFISRNKLHPIKPGTVVLINSTELHYSNPTDASKYNRSKLIISMDCFKQICSLCNLMSLFDELMDNGSCCYPFEPKTAIAKRVDSLLNKASVSFSNIQNLPDAQSTIITCTIELLTLLTYCSTIPENIDKSDSIIHQMTDYINKKAENWDDFSLEDICKELHISHSYASYLFKKLTNKSMTQYVMDLRLAEATKLLLTTDLKVFDIAEMLNFKDSTTFCKIFKKHIGCTPRHFRLSAGDLSANASNDSNE